MQLTGVTECVLYAALLLGSFSVLSSVTCFIVGLNRVFIDMLDIFPKSATNNRTLNNLLLAYYLIMTFKSFAGELPGIVIHALCSVLLVIKKTLDHFVISFINFKINLVLQEREVVEIIELARGTNYETY